VSRRAKILVGIFFALLGTWIIIFLAPTIMLPENGDFTICNQGICVHHIRVIDSIGYLYLGWGGQLLWPEGQYIVGSPIRSG
jgi:hypothetical protein